MSPQIPETGEVLSEGQGQEHPLRGARQMWISLQADWSICTSMMVGGTCICPDVDIDVDEQSWFASDFGKCLDDIFAADVGRGNFELNASVAGRIGDDFLGETGEVVKVDEGKCAGTEWVDEEVCGAVWGEFWAEVFAEHLDVWAGRHG